MLSSMKGVLVALGFSLTLAVGQAAYGDIFFFDLAMDSSQSGEQAGVCNGHPSTATGSGTLSLDTNTGQVNFNITFSGLTTPETVSHTHGAAAECFTAPPVVFLPLGSPKIGNYVLTAQQQADMIAELHYVNVHSQMFPAGEIRGQILLREAVPTVSEWGLVILTLLLLSGIALKFGRRIRAAEAA